MHPTLAHHVIIGANARSIRPAHHAIWKRSIFALDDVDVDGGAVR
jgi:hypothetical protein